ncbi:hypothetical protein CORC01_12104 [Colletotrichum orchidophilum]|uniref:CHAT domain-containing protein n=1 Tax=Colletotrichum orchidophilum TaxID=1209926 RepID=A0A1G4AU27_9PEZI|nr:uncharacterized protein CORC01_12104 [Colletotrichum orchidophilum]OHE92593.1 hypothetical protein CORC01_12104 [Colletotrichum orchidophilum]
MSNSAQSNYQPIDSYSSIDGPRDGVFGNNAELNDANPSHQEKATKLNEQCEFYLKRWLDFKNPNDVAEAVRAGRAAARALTPHNTISGRVLGNLAASLSEMFRHSHNVEDIDDAIENGKLALKCLNSGEPAWNSVYSNLLEMVYQKGARGRTAQSLDEAIDFMEQEGDPGDTMPSSRESKRLTCLSTLLSHRFECTGSMGHLERAIKVGYESTQRLEKEAEGKEEYHCTFLALIAHFRVTRHLNSLEEALRISNLLKIALNSGPYSDGQRAGHLCNHGSLLEMKSQRYYETNTPLSMEALDEALKAGREALSIMRPFEENRPHVEHSSLFLSMISSWMGTKAKMSQDAEQADEGIEILNRALELNTGHSIDDPTLLSNLSHLWEIKYSILRETMPELRSLQLLDTAIDLGERAVNETKDDDRNIGERRKNLALMLISKYLVLKDPEVLRRANEMLNKAAKTVTATLSIRIPSALQAGLNHYDEKELDEANKLFQDAIGLLTNSNLQAASAEDLQQTLRDIPGLGSYAASTSLALGRPFEALKSLESANCVIAGLTMSSRADTSELERQHPDVASAYVNIRTKLVQATRQLKTGGNYNTASTLQKSLLGEMGRKEDEIRRLRGFEQFQLPLDAEQVMNLAAEGPVVTINVSKLRSDAFIVTKDCIKSLPLEKLTHQALQERVSIFSRLGNAARRNAVPIPEPSDLEKTSTDAALEWLWDVAVRPILDVTELTSSGRLWWITSGLAGRAPFHAAGPHASGPDESAKSRMRSSYISSFKALKFARERRSASFKRQGMLLVTMSTNPPPHHNLNTAYEEEAIKSVFPDGKMHHLAHPDPNTVLEKITDCSFVHFACHGASIGNDPNKSGLLLVKDGKRADLTIADLDAVELKEGSVVYLSACSTAEQTDGSLAGEAIHLANSFQALGFQHVVGTMWGADDAAAGEVAKRFYEKLGKLAGPDGGDSRMDVANALHEAVKEYRLNCQEQDSVLNWGPFIHVGI